MRLRLEASPEELEHKGDSLIRALVAELSPVAHDLAERLEKALPPREQILKYPVLQQLADLTREEYARTLERMIVDIGKVLDQAAQPAAQHLEKSEGFYDFTKPVADRDERAYERAKQVLQAKGYLASDFEYGGALYGYSVNELLDLAGGKELEKAQAGPFIGPRGGKWADAAHTVPWRERKENGVHLTVKLERQAVKVHSGHAPANTETIKKIVVGSKIAEGVWAITMDGKPHGLYSHKNGAWSIQGRRLGYPTKWRVLSQLHAEDFKDLPDAFPLKKSGGPYIGPRGGKWADAEHTISWQEPEPSNALVGRTASGGKPVNATHPLAAEYLSELSPEKKDEALRGFISQHSGWSEADHRSAARVLEQHVRELRAQGASVPEAVHHHHNYHEEADRHLYYEKMRRLEEEAAPLPQYAVSAPKVEGTVDAADAKIGKQSEEHNGVRGEWYSIPTDVKRKLLAKIDWERAVEPQGDQGFKRLLSRLTEVGKHYSPSSPDKMVVFRLGKTDKSLARVNVADATGIALFVRNERANMDEDRDRDVTWGGKQLLVYEIDRPPQFEEYTGFRSSVAVVGAGQQNPKLSKSGGPYVGPRGGLWADPQHTQHWEPGSVPSVRPASAPTAKLRANELVSAIEKLGGKIRPHETDSTKAVIKLPPKHANVLTQVNQAFGLFGEIKTGGKYVMLAVPKALVTVKTPVKAKPQAAPPAPKPVQADTKPSEKPPYAKGDWKPHATVEEAKAWAKERGLDVGYTDLDTANQLNHAISEQHPMVQKHVEFLGTTSQLHGWAAEHPEIDARAAKHKGGLQKFSLGGSAIAVAHPTTGKPYTQSVVIVADSWGTAEKYAGKAKNFKTGFTLGNELVDTVRHEFGHVEGFVFRHLYPQGPGGPSAWEVWKKHCVAKLKADSKGVMKDVSQYGATNPHECWAEVSVMRRRGMPLPGWIQAAVDEMQIDTKAWDTMGKVKELTLESVSSPASIAASFAAADKAHAAARAKFTAALNALPEGYGIKGWSHAIIVGDHFWMKGKKVLVASELLEHLGPEIFATHIPAWYGATFKQGDKP